jgi:hypothetical protein
MEVDDIRRWCYWLAHLGCTASLDADKLIWEISDIMFSLLDRVLPRIYTAGEPPF